MENEHQKSGHDMGSLAEDACALIARRTGALASTLAVTLSKPFSPAQLEETVNEVLAQHTGRRPFAAGISQ